MVSAKTVLIPVVILAVLAAAVLLFIYDDVEKHRAFETVQTDLCDVYLDGIDLRGELCMYNPNDVEAILDRVDVRVYSGNNKIADVTVPKNISIPPMSRSSADIDIDVKWTGLLGAGFDRLTGGSTAITVQGTAYYDSIFGTFSHDFVNTHGGSDSYDFVNTHGGSDSYKPTMQNCGEIIDDDWFLQDGYFTHITLCRTGLYTFQIDLVGDDGVNGFEFYLLPPETDPVKFINEDEGTYLSDCSEEETWTAFGETCRVLAGSTFLVHNPRYQGDGNSINVEIQAGYGR